MSGLNEVHRLMLDYERARIILECRERAGEISPEDAKQRRSILDAEFEAKELEALRAVKEPEVTKEEYLWVCERLHAAQFEFEKQQWEKMRQSYLAKLEQSKEPKPKPQPKRVGHAYRSIQK